MTIPRNLTIGRPTFSKKETRRMCFHKLFVSFLHGIFLVNRFILVFSFVSLILFLLLQI